MVPVANYIVYDLDGTESKSASVLLVTIWEFGEAFGPLVLAPLSESIGRYPVFNVANMLFISATLLAALSHSTPLFITARALTGLAVASNVLNPAIVGDMFIEEERGSAMSAIMLAPLLGGAVGPAIAGAIAENLGWRWVLWIAIILAGSCEVVFFTCFRETFPVPILNRRVAKLRKETGNHALRTSFDFENPEAENKGSKKLLDAVLRPFVVFLDSGVLQAMSLFGSLEFAYFYVMSTTLPDILEGIYRLSPARTGLAFIVFSAYMTISHANTGHADRVSQVLAPSSLLLFSTSSSTGYTFVCGIGMQATEKVSQNTVFHLPSWVPSPCPLLLPFMAGPRNCDFHFLFSSSVVSSLQNLRGVD